MLLRQEQQDLKTLCNIIDIEPTDNEGEETQFDIGEQYSNQYDLLQLYTYFGTEDFKENYLININNIRNQTIPQQASLCRELLDKIDTIYGFTFPQTPKLLIQNDLDKVYDLSAFLHFDYLEFVENVWKSFRVNSIMNIDIKDYFSNKSNINKLLEQITNNSLLYDEDSLINKFLNFCDRDNILRMFIYMSNKSKVEISTNLMKGLEL